MSKNFSKIALFSIALLLAHTASAKKAEESSKITFKDIQKNKSAFEFPLGQTSLTAMVGLDPLGWGVKYDYEMGTNPVGQGKAKLKLQLTVGDTINSTQWIAQLARTALVEAPLATDTWVGNKLAVFNTYVLLVNKEVREKIKELLALKKQQPVTLEAQRAQVSRMLVLKAEIAQLLAQ